MEYLYTMFGEYSNHTIANQSNVYNFVILVFEDARDDDQRRKVIDTLKLCVGMKFSDGLKNYIFRKNPKHNILNFL